MSNARIAAAGVPSLSLSHHRIGSSGNRVGNCSGGVASAPAESSRFAPPPLSLRSFGCLVARAGSGLAIAGRFRPATENTRRMMALTLCEVPYRISVRGTARRASAGPRGLAERSDVYSAALAPTRNPEASPHFPLHRRLPCEAPLRQRRPRPRKPPVAVNRPHQPHSRHLPSQLASAPQRLLC